MAVDPNLLAVKPISELPIKEKPDAADEFLVFDSVGLEMKKTQMNDIYSKIIGSFSGTLMISESPTPTLPTWYFAGESGTYTNAGGLVVDLTGHFVILNYDGTTWSKVEVELPGSAFATASTLPPSGVPKEGEQWIQIEP